MSEVNRITIPSYPDDEQPSPNLFTFWGGLMVDMPVDTDEDKILLNLKHQIFKGEVSIDLNHLLDLELNELTEDEDELEVYVNSIKPQLELYKNIFDSFIKKINLKLYEVNSFIIDNS